MKQIVVHEDVEIPKGVKVIISGRTVTVKGPRGVLVKNFNHLKIKLMQIKNKTVRAELWFGNKAAAACCRTVITHIKNMMIGVTKGFLYRMKLVYSHFPITVTTEGQTVEIRNFVGEKIVRKVVLPAGVTLDKPKDVKDELVIAGNDIDGVAQACADIHISTLVRDKDIRKFLDGIYVSYKGNVIEE